MTDSINFLSTCIRTARLIRLTLQNVDFDFPSLDLDQNITYLRTIDKATKPIGRIADYVLTPFR